jgi:hypothetical protein
VSTHRRLPLASGTGNVAHEPEFEVVSQILREGQVRGEFRGFDPRVVAITLRHGLDVEAYTNEVVLFDRATRA